MKLNLGIKIRELRRRDGRTQEALAEALGVTGQAVSRWESGGSYPDMEILPSIANYFGVTIDELFGYSNDREKKIAIIIEKADKEIRTIGNTFEQGNGDISECVEMLRAASEEFPNEPQILLRFGDALHILGWQKYGARVYSLENSDYICDDVGYNSKNIYWQNALHIYEKLLKMNISADCRSSAIFSMIMLYQKTGAYEKAEELANKQDSIVLCKEVLLPRTCVGAKRESYQGKRILALLQELYIAISDSVVSKHSVHSTEYGKTIFLSLINLYETIFNDKRFGNQHMTMRDLYLTLANYEAKFDGSLEKAIAYFEKGLEHHQEYCRIYNAGDYHYSAPLFAKATTPNSKLPSVPENFWTNWMETMPKNLWEKVKENLKYAECFTQI